MIMMSILKNISFEAVIAYTAIIIPAIIWAFLKMKKKNPNDCSRVILLSFIPLFISIVFEKYCFQKNIGGFFSQVSSALFFICLAAVFITSAIVAVISYKQKGTYYETLKERKPILVACGVVLVIGILLLLCAKFFM